jgi:hypothetical protein
MVYWVYPITTVVVVVVVGHNPRLLDDTPGKGGITNVPSQAHT